jgi:2-succinyl-5-enolpyruvyl-6-hydroxy-3-cyclohexene-1-carboxylate synthase
VAVLGDTAFYHDMNGLLAARRHGLRVTFVVVNNDGGGIFSFLPGVRDDATLDPLFAMPHGLTFGHAAALYGLDYARTESWDEFRAEVARAARRDRSSVIEIPGDRETNRRLHEEVWSAGAAAARRALET